MEDLVERVARAMFNAGMSMHAPLSWEACNDGQRVNVRRQAQAAIDEIARTGTGCGVCGCLVYPGMPTRRS